MSRHYHSLLNVLTSAAFSYAKNSYHQDETDPTPTITGTTGGTFSATPSGLSINASTGTIDLSASTIQPYTITYTVDGVSANFNLSVTASPFIANTYSMNFDSASSQYIYGPPLGDLIDRGATTSTFTISCWIYAPSTGYRGICASAQFSNGIRLYTNSGQLYFGVSGGASTITAAANYAGNWHHVAATCDFTSSGTTMYLYFDGSEIANGSGNRGVYDFLDLNLDIGALNNGGVGLPSNYWLGNIDEFAIWNTALGETAIQEIYNATNNNTGKALDLSTDYNNYTSSSNLQYWNRLGD